MLAVELNGGLGNQLFQLAAAETIANETGRTFCVMDYTTPETKHSSANYFSSVLSEWKNTPILPHPRSSIKEDSFKKKVWSFSEPNVLLSGYFQNWKYISRSFRLKLKLLETPPTDTAFLHIRGGDYVNHSLHDVRLYNYYERAIKHFPKDTHFYVFTNDINYAKTMQFLRNIPHSLMTTDEVTSLTLMSKCARGGICANSSFSWWGAFLNPNRTIVMPDKWYNDQKEYTEGYYFPGVIRCRV
jgi:hypothetical protein